MNKPVLKRSFSVDDIHKLREYHYEKTKEFSSKELIEEINEKANKVREKINANRKKTIAM